MVTVYLSTELFSFTFLTTTQTKKLEELKSKINKEER